MTHRRTTFMLDEELYRAVKRKAIDRGRPMRILVEEALRAYLGKIKPSSEKSRPKFGVFPSSVRGSLRREDIYKEYLNRKFQ